MVRPKALDLFCKAGGVSMGLHCAGFDVVGIDIEPQPRYPFTFVRADALQPPFNLADFDFIWASPPCQAHTAMRTMHNALPHPDLIPATRELLSRSGKAWAMENVVGAPLINPATLCGTMFGLGHGDADLRRHRWLETSFPLPALSCSHSRPETIGIYGGHIRNRKRRPGSHARGVADYPLDAAQAAMQIDWMTLGEMCQAIPPAYAEFVGRAALRAIGRGE